MVCIFYFFREKARATKTKNTPLSAKPHLTVVNMLYVCHAAGFVSFNLRMLINLRRRYRVASSFSLFAAVRMDE